MDKRLAAAGLAFTALALAGCGTDTSQARPIVAHGVAAREPVVSPRPYGTADASFGLDLLGAWCRTDPRANLVLSPSSLASGLGMAYLGARGGTAQAIASVLHLPAASGQALEAGLQARSAALRALARPGVTLDASDQVWADPGLTTLRSYLDAVATGYDAGVAQAPLLRSPDRAAREIDQAIATATRGQIPQLLAPGSLNGIGWVLTDALYLQAAWATPFQADQTSPGPFTTVGGQQVSVPFMNGGPYRTASAGGWTGVWLPYRGGKLAMVALLPPAGAGTCAMPATILARMTARLAGPDTAGWTTQDIALPRVSLHDQVSLKGLLSGLGMGVAFTPGADFSGLSPQACCIGLIEHAAALKVGEEGTVASAATAVGIAPTAARLQSPPVAFDRPYLMLVADSATGEPLFLARVANPATEPAAGLPRVLWCECGYESARSTKTDRGGAMTEHPNIELSRRGYDAFAKGDMATLTELIADDVVWHVRGVGPLDGDYHGRDQVFGFFGRLAEETGGTFRLDVHDILANDEHTAVLCNLSATRGNKSVATQVVNVSHTRDGRITEFWSATTDPQAALDFWA